MSNTRSFIRPLIVVTCIGLTALGLRNTYADNTEEKKLAEQLVCSDPACSARLISESRSALGQSFAFQIVQTKAGRTQSSGVAQIECARALIFLGAYQCERKN